MLEYFGTLAAVVALDVLITEGIIKTCKVAKDWAKQLIAWVTPIVLSVVGLLCGWGIFAEYGTPADWYAWVYTALTGVGVGLVANGVYDINLVQRALEYIVSLIEKLRKKEEVTTMEIVEGVALVGELVAEAKAPVVPGDDEEVTDSQCPTVAYVTEETRPENVTPAPKKKATKKTAKKAEA